MKQGLVFADVFPKVSHMPAAAGVVKMATAVVRRRTTNNRTFITWLKHEGLSLYDTIRHICSSFVASSTRLNLHE